MFQCSVCPYRTNRKNNLSKHIISMHTKMTREIRCCGNIFHNKWEVKHHNITVHSDGYHCSLCGRTFQRKDLLGRHLSVHSGKKKFKCAACSYSSSKKTNLKRHWRVHGGSNADFKHVPEVMAAPACLETFSSPLLHTLRYSPRQPSPYLWSIEEGLRHSPLSVPTLDTHRSPVFAKQTQCPSSPAQDNDTGHRLPLLDSFVLWSSHGSHFPRQVRPTLQCGISPSVHHLHHNNNWDLLDSLARPYHIRSSNIKGSLRQTETYQTEITAPPSPEKPTITQLMKGQLRTEAAVSRYGEWEKLPEGDQKHQHCLGKHAPTTVVRPTPLRHYYQPFSLKSHHTKEANKL